ncbi:hypothetical protein VSS74_26720, partial [Conexibacter stalactiti]
MIGARWIAATALLLAVATTPARAAGTAQPVLGLADSETIVMGAATAGAAGETWAYRQAPLDLPLLQEPAGLLAFGPVANPTSPSQQLFFERYDDATGVWSAAQTPVDEQGQPYRGPRPNAASARITPRGGGVLVGSDPQRARGSQTVVLVRNATAPGDRFTALPQPPADIVLPADELTREPAEALAQEDGEGHVALAAYDTAAGRTGLFVGLTGRPAERAVAHWDGSAWSRETIELPTETAASFSILAIGATSPDNAYLLARTDATLEQGVVLYARVADDDGIRWVPRQLAAPLFEQARTAASGVELLSAFDGDLLQALTVTADGLWIDGELQLDGGRHSDFTLHWSRTQERVTGSWCDATAPDGAALCDRPLGLRFGRRAGYRSFAFAGEGFGSRVLTNPLAEGGDDTSNAGTWARFDGERFTRQPGAGDNYRASGGFVSADRGWIEGPVQVTDAPTPSRFAQWPVSLRAPLAAIVTAPDGVRGSLASGALAVGASGAVARFTPGGGWEREFLLSSTGAVSAPQLRAVAWPEAGRAYAVGDLGAMWLWRSETGLWERDAAAPIAFDGNLMGVAFAPGDGQRGYAVGRAGVLLAYGKTWEQQVLPPGFERADFSSIAFAGQQALVAAGSDVLLNDGSGWRVDTGLHELLARSTSQARIVTVAGLPDGGAIAAGGGVVFVRDSATAAWRPSAAPLPAATVVAAAPVRVGERVRAIVSVTPGATWPIPTVLPPPDPELPDPVLPPFALPGDGYVLRETDSGWRDEQRTAYAGVTNDKPQKSDPVAAFALDPVSGAGWAVGGWSGQPDSAGRGTSASGSGATVRARVQTAAITRYAPDAVPESPIGTAAAGVALEPGTVTFAVAGHATCDGPCSLLAGAGLGPDRAVSALVDSLRPLTGLAGGPRALLYTGGRLPTTSATATPAPDSARLAELLAQSPLPVFGAVSAADSLGDSVAGFRSAFAGMPAPFGTAAAPPGAIPVGNGDTSIGTRTHYAVDSSGGNGIVRVIVIDNSRGSLAASDPYQVPLEPQEPWLRATLQDARAQGVPAIVVGSRDLNTRFVPRSNVADDGDAIARLLVDEGASAYLYERPEEQRVTQIPAGGAQTIPAYGTGTLGYRSPIANAQQPEQADAVFGDSGYLLLSLDLLRRDPATNRAPVSVRMQPLIKQLSLAAIDGTLLRRSRPALFQGLGRRPLGGDRWGPISASDGSPNPTGADPYVSFPAALCLQANCGTRLTPEYRFSSSDPDVADFVAVDPNTANLRKPLQGADGKVVTDATSGLLCAFNPGRTTLTVSAGGMSYSQVVTVQTGSVQQPCGTRPLSPEKFRRVTEEEPAVVAPPPAAPPPAVAPSPS